jgi:hypothetical protein
MVAAKAVPIVAAIWPIGNATAWAAIIRWAVSAA